MKTTLSLLTVAMIAASLSGCCCRRLCPWLDRGAYCGSPAPIFAPLAAAPAPMPAYQPYTYAAPLAATAPNTCCPAPAPAPTACCSSWDPCQGVVNYSYPGANTGSPCCGQTAAPCCNTAAPMMYSGEVSCGYEPGCGSPYMGGMSYGPMMTSGCSTCGTGYSGGAIESSGPTTVMPSPGE